MPISHLHTKPLNAWQTGEILTYRIRWGLLTIGTARMEVRERIIVNGQNCYQFKSAADGTDFINTFFPIRDRISSCWNPQTGSPVRTVKDLNEGNYHRYYEADFKTDRSVKWKERSYSGNTDKPGKKRANPVVTDKSGITENLPVGFLDILSAIYYTRAYPREGLPGNSFRLTIYDDLKTGILVMNILKKDTVTTEINSIKTIYEALVVKPEYETTGVFRSSGRVIVWISDDHRRLPLVIKAKIPYMGSVTVELTGYSCCG